MRARRDLVRSEVLGEEQVTERRDRVRTCGVEELAEGSAFPAQVLRPAEVADPDVAQAARAGEQYPPFPQLAADPVADVRLGQSLLGLGRSAGLDPTGNEDEQPSAGPLVRIGVERDVEPLA